MRRKNIIKNIAIVFLVILLILTFFSQTIMNYSLPEVATQMIESGSVSPQIRGTGTIEADDPYDVVVKEIRKISSVPVKVGDHVEKDGILYYLEEQESPDLIEAQEKLEDLEQSYELSLLRGDIDDRIINRVRGGYTATFEEYQKALTAATKKVEQLEDQSKEMQKQLDAMELANNWTDNQRKYDKATDEYAEADWALRIAEMDAQKDLNDDEIEELTDSIDDLKLRIEDIEDDMEEAKEDDKTKKYERLKEQYAAAQRTLSELQDRKWELQDMNESFERETNEIELAKARQEHDTSQLDTQTDQVDIHYDQELLVMKDQKDKVDKDLEEAKDDRDELLNDISREIELDASRK
ncbi:MAG: hypothetical protein IJT34_11260, partial [Butyrivibrio sp.]|nr:hypothetical protein [Butyrivibrio sp.]